MYSFYQFVKHFQVFSHTKIRLMTTMSHASLIQSAHAPSSYETYCKTIGDATCIVCVLRGWPFSQHFLLSRQAGDLKSNARYRWPFTLMHHSNEKSIQCLQCLVKLCTMECLTAILSAGTSFCWTCLAVIDGYDHFKAGGCLVFDDATIAEMQAQNRFDAMAARSVITKLSKERISVCNSIPFVLYLIATCSCLWGKLYCKCSRMTRASSIKQEEAKSWLPQQYLLDPITQSSLNYES